MLTRALSQIPPPSSLNLIRAIPVSIYQAQSLKHFSSKKEKEERVWKLLRERDMRDNPERYKYHWWVTANRDVFKTQENFMKFPQQYASTLAGLVNSYELAYRDQEDRKIDDDIFQYIDEPVRDSEKEAIRFKAENEEDRDALLRFPNRESPDRYKRQPRLSLDYSYNYEQHRQFTKVYKEQSEKDKAAWIFKRKFYKYLYHNQKKDLRAQGIIEKEQIDFTQLPMDEIEAMDISDFSLPRKKKRRVKILTRTSRDISNYDAWRCFDRSFLPCIQDFSKVLPQGKVRYPPALIKEVFGSPKESSYLCNNVSTVLEFQDTYLDTFVVYEYRQTQVYHGLNREPEYYEYLRKRKGPGTRMRKRPWPTPTQFWELEEPKEFRIHGPRYCAIHKFKTWFHTQVKRYVDRKQEAELKGQKILTKDEQILQKFAEGNIGQYHGKAEDVGEFEDYDKHYPELQQREIKPLVFRMDYRYWMTPEELKDLKEDELPQQFEEHPLIDFDIAERVNFTQDDLNKMTQQEEIKDERLEAS